MNPRSDFQTLKNPVIVVSNIFYFDNSLKLCTLHLDVDHLHVGNFPEGPLEGTNNCSKNSK
jgi:hypothetical protein